MKSAFITIAGRPSAGKSTLLNKICGNKVSIVSKVPQTTRNKIRGIYNKKGIGQLIFLDTPGYNISEKKFNNYLKQIVSYSVEESDMILYMVDITRTPGDEETAVVELLKKSAKPVILALNKTDRDNNNLETYKEFLQTHFPEKPLYLTSGKTGEGVKELLAALIEAAPEGAQHYPEEYYTDQPPEFRISEIIREKIILQTREEVPHAVYVEIADLEMREKNKTLWVRGFIYVERDSQKGIIIGKGGSGMKSIREAALEDLKDLFSCKIQMNLSVKVKPKWRKDDQLINQLLK